MFDTDVVQIVHWVAIYPRYPEAGKVPWNRADSARIVSKMLDTLLGAFLAQFFSGIAILGSSLCV